MAGGTNLMDRMPQSTWKSKYDSLLERINMAESLRELPSNDEIERLVAIADRGFKGSKFYDYIMHKNIKLRNNYIHKRNRMLRKIEQQKEERRQRNSFILDDTIKTSLINIISNIDSNTSEADSVSIELTKDGGVIKFEGDLSKEAFDWSNAILSKATSLFPIISPIYTESLTKLYDYVEPVLSVSPRDSYAELEEASNRISAAYRKALNDNCIYKVLDEESNRTGASKEIIFLKLLEEEGSIRKLYV
jgi:hypothetical protein